jgi:F0F1-type ATP synthase alpha subunit
MEEEAAILFVASAGLLKECPVEAVPAFLRAFLKHLKGAFPELLDGIARTKEITAEAEAALNAAASAFADEFLTKKAS